MGANEMTRDGLIDFAQRVATNLFETLKKHIGSEFSRVDQEDLRQEAVVFVLETEAERCLEDRAKIARLICNHLAKYVRRDCGLTTKLPSVVLPNLDPMDSGPFADPADRAEMNEVLEAVDMLKPKQRFVISGTLAGVDTDSMSRLLGTSHRSVYQLRHRGIQSLRSILGVA
jgi:DNA-directed RNA polymerase specialized sigma24 family protein